MSFNLSVPSLASPSLNFIVQAGETLFVLGGNGAGKSSLMHLFYISNQAGARRISAHRQTWFQTSSIGISGREKQTTETNIRNTDVSPEARWSDSNPAARAGISIYELIDSENTRARLITKEVDARNIVAAEALSSKDAPIKIINELMCLSNLPIEIAIAEDQQVVASKNGGAVYSIAKLSDGERNALLIAADVLTAKPGSLILIDEPERHLHRSIISPLLTELFARKSDCAFVVSTHEVMLPLDNPHARTLLVRGCTYNGETVTAWDADLVSSEAEIVDDLKRDILGGRRKLLFIEGTESSLDKPLYSLIFPNVSIIAKVSCRDVEHAVAGIRDADGLHWVQAFGVIDNDGRSQTDIERLEVKGVYAVSVHSVESIYYHPEIQRRVAEAHAAVTGDNATTLLATASAAVIASMTPVHVQRLSARVVENQLREEIGSHMPRQEDIQANTPVNISIDVAAVVAAETARFQAAVATNDSATIIGRYPVRETPALDRIAKALGFKDRAQYEGAVRKLLMTDGTAVTFIRSLFGTLEADINAV